MRTARATIASRFDEARIRWACDVLRISSLPAVEETQAAAFDAVSESEFDLEPEIAEAVDIVSVRPTFARLDSLPSTLSREQALLREIAVFAREFFSMDHRERRARWETFREPAERFPTAQRRLRQLQPGLEIAKDLPPDVSPPLRALMQFVRELFVAPPARRPMLRNAFLRSTRGADRLIAADAAHELAQDYAGTAGLEPGFVQKVRCFDPFHRILVQSQRAPRFVMPPVTSHIPEPRRRPARSEPVDGNGDGSARMSMAWTVGMVVLLVRVLYAYVQPAHSPHTSASSRPVDIPRHVSTDIPQNSRLMFRPAWPRDVLALLKREPELQPGDRCRAAARLLHFFRANIVFGGKAFPEGVTDDERAAAHRILTYYLEMSDRQDDARRHGIAMAELPPAAEYDDEPLVPLSAFGGHAEVERAIRSLEPEGDR